MTTKLQIEFKKAQETFPTEIVKHGNSLGINIPSNIVKKLCLQTGSEIDVTIKTNITK